MFLVYPDREKHKQKHVLCPLWSHKYLHNDKRDKKKNSPSAYGPVVVIKAQKGVDVLSSLTVISFNERRARQYLT